MAKDFICKRSPFQEELEKRLEKEKPLKPFEEFNIIGEFEAKITQQLKMPPVPTE